MASSTRSVRGSPKVAWNDFVTVHHKTSKLTEPAASKGQGR